MTREDAITYLEDAKHNLPYKFGQALDMAIEALSNNITESPNGAIKPSNDVINRADAIKAVAKLQKYDLDERNRLRIYAPWHKPKRIFVETEAIYKCIYTMPSAEVKTKCVAEIKVDTEDIYTRITGLMPDAVQGWIPCSERLPEEGERVLATHLGGVNPNRQVIEHIYQCGEFTCGWDMDMNVGSPTFGQRYMGKVIAWMPLPEPYREDGEA